MAIQLAEKPKGCPRLAWPHPACDAYNATFRPSDEDREDYLKRGILLGGGVWMAEYTDDQHRGNSDTIEHERLTFLAMAHAVAKAGDLA